MLDIHQQIKGGAWEDDTYTIPNAVNFLKNAFGEDGIGTDGGGFVEFHWGIEGSGAIPNADFNYDPPGAVELVDFLTFTATWSGHSLKNSNIIQMIAASPEGMGLGYNTREDNGLNSSNNFALKNNTAVVFHKIPINAPPNYDLDQAKPETMIHELGHIFEVEK